MTGNVVFSLKHEVSALAAVMLDNITSVLPCESLVPSQLALSLCCLLFPWCWQYRRDSQQASLEATIIDSAMLHYESLGPHS